MNIVLEKAKINSKIIIALFSMFALGVVTVSTVNAAIPDASGTIHACYTTGLLGRVKIIDSPSQTCGGGETPVSWSQNGSSKGVLKDDVSSSDFANTSMINWDLRGLDFSNSLLTGAQLKGVDLRGANLTSTNFTGSDLTNANLSSLNLSGTLLSAGLRGANLTGTTFTNVSLTGADLFDQDLSGRDLSTITNFGSASFTEGSLNGATLPSSPQLIQATFENTDMRNLNLVNADLSGSYFVGANFTGSNLTGAIWVSSAGAATCPDATLASDHGDTCIGHL